MYVDKEHVMHNYYKIVKKFIIDLGETEKVNIWHKHIL